MPLGTSEDLTRHRLLPAVEMITAGFNGFPRELAEPVKKDKAFNNKRLFFELIQAVRVKMLAKNTKPEAIKLKHELIGYMIKSLDLLTEERGISSQRLEEISGAVKVYLLRTIEVYSPSGLLASANKNAFIRNFTGGGLINLIAELLPDQRMKVMEAAERAQIFLQNIDTELGGKGSAEKPLTIESKEGQLSAFQSAYMLYIIPKVCLTIKKNLLVKYSPETSESHETLDPESRCVPVDSTLDFDIERVSSLLALVEQILRANFPEKDLDRRMASGETKKTFSSVTERIFAEIRKENLFPYEGLEEIFMEDEALECNDYVCDVVALEGEHIMGMNIADFKNSAVELLLEGRQSECKVALPFLNFEIGDLGSFLFHFLEENNILENFQRLPTGLDPERLQQAIVKLIQPILNNSELLSLWADALNRRRHANLKYRTSNMVAGAVGEMLSVYFRDLYEEKSSMDSIQSSDSSPRELISQIQRLTEETSATEGIIYELRQERENLAKELEVLDKFFALYNGNEGHSWEVLFDIQEAQLEFIYPGRIADARTTQILEERLSQIRELKRIFIENGIIPHYNERLLMLKREIIPESLGSKWTPEDEIRLLLQLSWWLSFYNADLPTQVGDRAHFQTRISGLDTTIQIAQNYLKVIKERKSQLKKERKSR